MSYEKEVKGLLGEVLAAAAVAILGTLLGYATEKRAQTRHRQLPNK